MTRNTEESSASVVIIGGGPVGVTLSIALANYGLDSIVLERDHGVHPLPRAALMDAEAQRSLIEHGAGEGLGELLTPMRTAEYVDTAGRRLAGADLDTVRVYGGLPTSSLHYQPELETYLREHAAQRGVRLVEGAAMNDFHIADDGATVVASADGGRSYTGRWLVGCDGASSTVRRQLGIGREDLGFDQDWLVVDIEVNDRATCGLPEVAWQICDPVRPTTMVSGHRRLYRWEFQIQPGEDPEHLNHPERVWELLSAWITPDKARLVRSATYKFHAGVAAQWRVGPVMLAGDSAHQMPPFMGQGLNSGMRDAFNLAWKLKWVTEGWASEHLLDTYSSERAEHSRATVEQSVDAGLLIDQFAGRQSHGVVPRDGYGGGRPRPRYSTGAIVGDHPRVGLPHPSWHQTVIGTPVGPEMVLLSADGRSPDEPAWRGPWRQMSVDRSMALGADHAVLRPDGYVAAVCDSEDLGATLGALREAMSAK